MGMEQRTVILCSTGDTWEYLLNRGSTDGRWGIINEDKPPKQEPGRGAFEAPGWAKPDTDWMKKL